MDPITLAKTATSLLIPFLSKAGEKAMDRIAEQLPEKIGTLWGGIWDRLKEKPAAAETAQDLVTNTGDVDNQQMFELQLRIILEKDAGFAGQLTSLVEEAKSDASLHIGGDGVVAKDNSTSVGSISIGGNVSGNVVVGNNNQVSGRLAGDSTTDAPPPPRKK